MCLLHGNLWPDLDLTVDVCPPPADAHDDNEPDDSNTERNDHFRNDEHTHDDHPYHKHADDVHPYHKHADNIQSYHRKRDIYEFDDCHRHQDFIGGVYAQ